MSPEATRRLYAAIARRRNAAYSSFSVTRVRRLGVKERLTPDRRLGWRGHHRYPPAVQSLHSPAERGM